MTRWHARPARNCAGCVTDPHEAGLIAAQRAHTLPMSEAARRISDMSGLQRFTTAGVLAMVLAGCATSSHVLIGTARPPIAPESVRVYLQPPPKYETIASIDATSQGSLALTSQQNMDKAIERMKKEAAKLGANGILLQGVQNQQSGAIGTGVGGSSYGGNSSVGVGVGGSFGLYSKATQGLAIYVMPQ
jgi:hypothetical protein